MKTFLLLLFPLAIWADCDRTYFINDQITLDNFIIDYGDCDNIDSLIIEITCEKDRITNLDSLIHIKEINYLKISVDCSNVSIDGFANLKKVNYFFTYALDSINSIYKFENLDTIIHLELTGRKLSSDLTNFKHTRYIEVLTLRGAGTCLGLNPLTKMTLKKIAVIFGERLGKLSDLFDGIFLDGLTIRNLKSFEITPTDNLRGISNLVCVGHQNLDLTALGEINFQAISLVGLTKPLPIFSKIDTIDIIQMFQNDGLINFNYSFPNLKKINSFISISSCINLEQLGIDSLELPYGKPSFNYLIHTRVRIEDNPKLIECSERFICDALKVYPDSVILSNNGEFCTLDYLGQYCKTVSTSEEGMNENPFYPNPANDYLKFNQTINHIEEYWIINMQGQIVQKSNFEGNEIDISQLKSGVYNIILKSKERHLKYKFVKGF